MKAPPRLVVLAALIVAMLGLSSFLAPRRRANAGVLNPAGRDLFATQQAKAAEGDAAAQAFLGHCYTMGWGVPVDPAKAAEWYRKAAEQGHGEALYQIAFMYERGVGVPRDPAQACAWFLRLFARYPWKTSPIGYRRHLDRPNDSPAGTPETAARQAASEAASFQEAVRNGWNYNVAVDYLTGRGVPQSFEQAVVWFRKDAASTNRSGADSQLELGLSYFNGQGVERNVPEALRWFRLAAEHGDSDARIRLGRCYEEGVGVERDLGEAAKWFRSAGSDYEGIYRFGVVSHALGNFAEAAHAFQEAAGGMAWQTFLAAGPTAQLPAGRP